MANIPATITTRCDICYQLYTPETKHKHKHKEKAIYPEHNATPYRCKSDDKLPFYDADDYSSYYPRKKKLTYLDRPPSYNMDDEDDKIPCKLIKYKSPYADSNVEQKFPIVVRFLSGNQYIIKNYEIYPSWRVIFFKHMLAYDFGIENMDTMTLIASGQKLDSEKTIESYHLVDGHTIYMIKRSAPPD